MVKCDMCGENEAVKTIPNPNYEGEGTWEVCERCDKYIWDTIVKDIKQMMDMLTKRRVKNGS